MTYVIAETGAYPGLAVPASIHLPAVKISLGIKRIALEKHEAGAVDMIDKTKLLHSNENTHPK